jgi:hypothetical protein
MATLLQPPVGALSPEGRSWGAHGFLEQRVAVLERQIGRIPVVAGDPSSSSAEGQLAGDTANTRLWLRVNGVWRYVALT